MTAKAKTFSAPQSAIMRGSWGDRLIIVLALVCTFIAFSPFGYAVLTSLKSEWKDGSIIPFLQFEPNLLNWQQEFGSGGAETMKALRNSTLISLGATMVATSLGTLAGYGLARFKYGVGNRNLVSWFLVAALLAAGGYPDSLCADVPRFEAAGYAAGHGHRQRDLYAALCRADYARLLRGYAAGIAGSGAGGWRGRVHDLLADCAAPGASGFGGIHA